MDAPLHDIVAEIYLAAVDGDQSRTFASKLAHAFRCESCMVSTANILDGNSALGGQVSRWFDGDPHQGS